MDFKTIVTQRYNAKKFDGSRTDEARLRELLDIIRYAPSADNLQPWKIKVIGDRETLDRLVPATLPFNQERIKTCSHLLLFCTDKDLESHWARLEQAMKNAGRPDEEIRHMGGVAKMIMGRPPGERLNRSQWDVFLAVGNAVNGAQALGIDASLMGGFNANEYARILGLPENLVPTLLVALGKAADSPPPKVRFSRDEIFF
ncbi:MAG: dihydropteridine reductase [Methanocella sp. PtaU1.Bin125]|nr:MAG: dihydropteridine reductase [Methanocella sp. PtaU1.Bin125]